MGYVMGKRIVLAIAIFLTMTLVACENRSGTFAGSKPAKSHTTITALVWAPDWPEQMHRIAAAFTEENPNIDVDIQFMIGNSVEENLKPKVAANSLPDLMSINPNAYAAELADRGILADVGATRAWQNMQDLMKSEWTTRWDKHYGISGGIAASLIYYNKTMFKQAGITALPTDFDEFLNVCRMLKKAGFTPIMWSGGFPNVLANGPFSAGFANNIVARDPDWKRKIADGTLNLNTPAAADIFAKIRLVADKGYVQKNYMSTGYDDGIALFAEGKTAMAFHGTWASGALMRNKHFETGAFIPPWNARGETVVPVIGSETGFAVAESGKKAAALKFLEFIYARGFAIQQRKRQNIAPFKRVSADLAGNPKMTDYVRKVEAFPLTAEPYYSYMPTNTLAMLHPLLQDVLLHRKTPQQAALAFDKSIKNEAMQNNK
jgi:multiple sugar transport system substrate-binding protein